MNYGCVYRASTTLTGYCLNCGQRQTADIHKAPAPVAARHANRDAVINVWQNTNIPERPLVSRNNALLALSIILGGIAGVVVLSFLMPAIWEHLSK